MSGKIIYEPPAADICLRLGCPDKPPACDYWDGTRWQCDECGAVWEVYSGAQYNEPYTTWRRLKNGITRD